MKLRNATRYDTRALRRLVIGIYRDLAKREGAGPWWGRLVVRVEPGRSQYPHGRAYLHGGPITLYLPPPARTERRAQGTVTEETRPDGTTVSRWTRTGPDQRVNVDGRPQVRQVAYVIGHELMHVWGYEHGQFSTNWEHYPVPPSCAGLGEFLPLKAERPRVPRDRVAERYARVVALEKAWARKAKLAETKLRVYRRKRREYERRLSTAPAPSGRQAA